jgi:PhnB protein
MLAIRNAAAAMDWYQRAFNATEVMRLSDPAGNVVHGELRICGGLLMLAEENPAFNASPQTVGESTVILNLLTDHVDPLFAQALAAGAKEVFPLQDQFYGYRAGRIQDPFGHLWILSQFLEDVSAGEMQRRMDEMMTSQ